MVTFTIAYPLGSLATLSQVRHKDHYPKVSKRPKANRLQVPKEVTPETTLFTLIQSPRMANGTARSTSQDFVMKMSLAVIRPSISSAITSSF
jgi:hypothetical protein